MAEEDGVFLTRGRLASSVTRAQERANLSPAVTTWAWHKVTEGPKKEGATVLFTSLTPPHCHNIIGFICACPSVLGTNYGVWLLNKQIHYSELACSTFSRQEIHQNVACYFCLFRLLVLSRFPVSHAATIAPLAVSLLRSSLNDQIEHILSRRCCWRVLCSLLRGRSTKGNKKRLVGAEFLVKTRTPEWRPTLLEDVASWVLSRGRGHQHSQSDRVLLGTNWLRRTLSNGASAAASDKCHTQLSQFWGIKCFFAFEFIWACTILNRWIDGLLY